MKLYYTNSNMRFNLLFNMWINTYDFETDMKILSKENILLV